MKKVIIVFLYMCFINTFYAQVSSSLIINDTRAINDPPNFYQHQIRADFKERNAIGVPGIGSYSTTLTLAQWSNTDNSGDKNHQLNFNNSGLFYRNAYALDSQWGNWRKIIIENENGNVGIGTTTPDEKLTVNGTIHATEVKVTATVPADYVFQKYYTGKSELKSDYVMPTLAEIESFSKKNNHLPNVPSAKEMQEKGMSLGEMSNLLLQKVEELTLYAIEQNKELERLKTETENYKSLAERLTALEKELKSIDKH